MPRSRRPDRLLPPGRRLLPALLVAAAMAASPAAIAHPSVMMTCRVMFNIQGGKVNGVGETWLFDEGFSAQLIADFDTDGDGRFSEAEIADLETESFGDLSAYRYFTYVSLDGEDLGRLEPFGFRAEIVGSRVRFGFGVRLPRPVDPHRHTVAVEIKDVDYVVMAVMAESDAAFVRGAADSACRPTREDDPANAYLGGTIVPERISLAC